MPNQTQVRCPNCGQAFMAVIDQAIDGGRDPQGKARLLSGIVNAQSCPNCQANFRLSAPFIYHDASKDLLIVHVPMELGLPRETQERVVGDLTKAIVNSIPNNERRGYLFTPKTALTFQGLIETVLEADGITKAMIEAQRNKMVVAETFLRADPATWPALAQTHAAVIDEEFFMLLDSSIGSAEAAGQAQAVEMIMNLQEALMQITPVGQSLLARLKQSNALLDELELKAQNLGENPSFNDVLMLIMGYKDQPEATGVIVAYFHPLLTTEFFALMDSYIEAAPAAEKPSLEAFKQALQQQMASVQAPQLPEGAEEALHNLQNLVNSPTMIEDLHANPQVINDTFMALLTANMQRAEEMGNQPLLAHLKTLFEAVISMVETNAPPPLRLLNQLLMLPDEAEALQQMRMRVAEFGPQMLQLLELLTAELSNQGAPAATLDRIKALHGAAMAGLGGAAAQTQAPAEATAPAEKPAASSILLPFDADRPRKRKK
jgi:CpXC protein